MHCVSCYTFDLKKSHRYILSECRYLASREVDEEEHYRGYACEDCDIDFRDNMIFNTESEAQKWLEDRVGDYHWIAVKYYDVSRELLVSSKLKSLKERLTETQNALKEMQSHSHFKGQSAKLVTCPTCDSKLNREQLVFQRLNVCPLCRNDMRPITALNRIKSLTNKVNELNASINEETNRIAMNNKKDKYLKWLVCVSVHC